MAKNAFKLSTMVGENFEIHYSQMAKNAFKLSTLVGENFVIYSFQLVKISSLGISFSSTKILSLLTDEIKTNVRKCIKNERSYNQL